MGGDPRSIGRVDEVVEDVLGDPALFEELSLWPAVIPSSECGPPVP